MLYDAHVRSQARMPRYVEKRIPEMQNDVGKTRSHVHGTMASVLGRIVHVHDDDGIPEHDDCHEMPNGNPLRSRSYAHDANVLQLRRQDHVPDHEVHAHDAHVQTEPEMQHRHDALHAQDHAVHGHERLPHVHGQIHGTFHETVRNENDRLFRSLLHHDL